MVLTVESSTEMEELIRVKNSNKPWDGMIKISPWALGEEEMIEQMAFRESIPVVSRTDVSMQEVADQDQQCALEYAESLKDNGEKQFNTGNYRTAADLYTEAIVLKPQNPKLYSNRAAAFLKLGLLDKALADAETTITLSPRWIKGYFSKGCILEAMEQYDYALTTFRTALQYDPNSVEISRKLEIISEMAKDKNRAREVMKMRSNVDLSKHLDKLKSEMSGSGERNDEFSFLVGTVEASVKSWHETSNVEARVYFLLDKEKTCTEKRAPAVEMDKAFESPDTHRSCLAFLRQYADATSRAACLVAPKSIVSNPQVWKGQGSKKWKHGQQDGFFVHFEAPFFRKLWFIPSSTELGLTLCRDMEDLDISAHELILCLFEGKSSKA